MYVKFYKPLTKWNTKILEKNEIKQFSKRSNLHGKDCKHNNVVTNLSLYCDGTIRTRIAIGKGFNL